MKLNSKKTVWTRWIGLLQSRDLTANPEMSNISNRFIYVHGLMSQCTWWNDVISRSLQMYLTNVLPRGSTHWQLTFVSIRCDIYNFNNIFFIGHRLKSGRMTWEVLQKSKVCSLFVVFLATWTITITTILILCFSDVGMWLSCQHYLGPSLFC